MYTHTYTNYVFVSTSNIVARRCMGCESVVTNLFLRGETNYRDLTRG